MLEESMITTAQEAIKRGEKTRILFEILLDQLECDVDSSLEDIFTKLKQHQEEYNEAVKMLSIVVQEHRKHKMNGKSLKQTQEEE